MHFGYRYDFFKKPRKVVLKNEIAIKYIKVEAAMRAVLEDLNSML